jgi:hypothetical protein
MRPALRTAPSASRRDSTLPEPTKPWESPSLIPRSGGRSLEPSDNPRLASAPSGRDRSLEAAEPPRIAQARFGGFRSPNGAMSPRQAGIERAVWPGTYPGESGALVRLLFRCDRIVYEELAIASRGGLGGRMPYAGETRSAGVGGRREHWAWSPMPVRRWFSRGSSAMRHDAARVVRAGGRSACLSDVVVFRGARRRPLVRREVWRAAVGSVRLYSTSG